MLLTGIQREQVFLFDPYYLDAPFENEEIQMVTDHPTAYNRIVPVWYFERETRAHYALGPVETREAVLLFNEQTMLTEEDAIEYIMLGLQPIKRPPK